MKCFFVCAGPNGSGKSTIISNLEENGGLLPLNGSCPKIRDLQYINADYIARTSEEIKNLPDG
jgi:predicted ABC-type ATPase